MSFTTANKAKKYIETYLEDGGLKAAQRAMEMCMMYHKGLRKDGETPEWFHQLSIVMYLIPFEQMLNAVEGYCAESFYCAAFLHDVREDYGVTEKEISSICGRNVADAVVRLSKKVPGQVAMDTQKYYDQMVDNPIASIVKGADRIHNFQTMVGVFNKEKQESYMAHCEEFILPMLKQNRKRYECFRPLYENLKHMLHMQIMLIREVRKGF